MRITAVALVVLVGIAARTPGTVVVGVLENPQCEPAGTLAVRALFAKPGSNWAALDGPDIFGRTIARAMSWTVTLDGSSLGSIRTRDPKADVKAEWTGVRERVLELAPGQRPPRRANPGHRFDGWCEPVPDRPLVVVTPSNFTDPEAWKPFRPGLTTKASLLPAFRLAVDSVFICPTDPVKAVRFMYTARDLRIARAYRNRKGLTIVGIQLEPSRNSCDGPPGDGWATHWFVLGNNPKPLGSGLELVDAGDYDADGRSELIFWYSGYNEDGYTLFARDFKERVDVRWGYH